MGSGNKNQPKAQESDEIDSVEEKIETILNESKDVEEATDTDAT